MNMVARYGGDEFVSVLSESDEGGARGYLARVKERVRTSDVLAKYGVTISSGIARSDVGKTVRFEELIQAADQQMYENKNR
jgi:diguanylate cyclase (GGDEF)-like protein